jgi:Protein of unknown function (DUF3221)
VGRVTVKRLILMAATLAVVVMATAPVALAQTVEPLSYVGYITSISGSSMLVEEDPQDPVLGGVGSNKGYFTVNGETEIFRLVEGDMVTPATFEELEVGQLVSATYSGLILQSYPPQGGAGSITILADAGEEPVCNVAEGCDFYGDGALEGGANGVPTDTAA